MEDDLRKNLYMTRLIAYGLFISFSLSLVSESFKKSCACSVTLYQQTE